MSKSKSKHAMTALTASGTVTTTCPAPFVKAGDKHIFYTTGALQFANGDAAAITVDISLRLTSDGRELARDDSTYVVPPSGTTPHVVTWRPEQTLHAGDAIFVINLVVKRADGNKDELMRNWQVCQFRVE